MPASPKCSGRGGFTRYSDDAEPGLARFVRDIIVAAYSAA
jgi:hypothetical protein